MRHDARRDAERGGHVTLEQRSGADRICVADDRARPHELAAFESDPLPRDDRRHLDSRSDDRAVLARRVCDAERDATHATLDERPAADEPEAVVRVDPRRAGLARAGERPDDALAVQGGPEALVLHVPLDDVGDRRVEHHVARLGIAGEQLLELGAVGRRPDPHVATRAAPQSFTDALEQRLVVVEPVDVGRRDRLHRGGSARGVVPLEQRRPVLERGPLRRVDHERAIAVARQIELVDHERVEQPHQVRARAHHEPVVGERALERAGTTEVIAPLEDEDGAPRPRQVRGRGEPVVPTADHDDVPVARSKLRDRRR